MRAKTLALTSCAFALNLVVACGSNPTRKPGQLPLGTLSNPGLDAPAECRVQNPQAKVQTLPTSERMQTTARNNVGVLKVAGQNQIFSFDTAPSSWRSLAQFSAGRQVLDLANNATNTTTYALVRDNISAKNELFRLAANTNQLTEVPLSIGGVWQKVFVTNDIVWLSGPGHKLVSFENNKWTELNVSSCDGVIDGVLSGASGTKPIVVCREELRVSLLQQQANANWKSVNVIDIPIASVSLSENGRGVVNVIAKNELTQSWQQSKDFGATWSEVSTQSTDNNLCTTGEVVAGPVLSASQLQAVLIRDMRSMTPQVKLCVNQGNSWLLRYSFTESRAYQLGFDEKENLHVFAQQISGDWNQMTTTTFGVDVMIPATVLTNPAPVSCEPDRASLFLQNYEKLFNAASRIEPSLKKCPSIVSTMNKFLTGAGLVSKRENANRGAFGVSVASSSRSSEGDALVGNLAPWEYVFYDMTDLVTTLRLLQQPSVHQREAIVRIEKTGAVKMEIKSNDTDLSSELLFEIDQLQQPKWTAKVSCYGSQTESFVFESGIVTKQ